MSEAIVRAAFESRIDAWAASKSPPIRVAHENEELAAPSALYLRVYLLPAQTLSETLAREHENHSGIFQVSVVERNGVGSMDVGLLAAELNAMFSPKTPLTQSGRTIWITQPMSMAAAVPEPDRYAVPLSFSYRLDTLS